MAADRFWGALELPAAANQSERRKRASGTAFDQDGQKSCPHALRPEPARGSEATEGPDGQRVFRRLALYVSLQRPGCVVMEPGRGRKGCPHTGHFRQLLRPLRTLIAAWGGVESLALVGAQRSGSAEEVAAAPPDSPSRSKQEGVSTELTCSVPSRMRA
jgi:hypothetical protein